MSRTIKVLQFGEGNFLRAFVDWMIDIANEQGITDMGIAVVPPRFHANRSMQLLQEQGCRYHVVLEGIKDAKPAREIRAIEAIAEAIVPEQDMEAYWRIVESDDLRFVVSNTTEAGIRYEHDDIHAPIPATFPGKVAALLYRRWLKYGGDLSKGLIFLCCELIEDNGSTLRQIVKRHASEAKLPQDFIDWIDSACIFCDTLVDRIVSGFPKDNAAALQAEIGEDDQLIVNGELFHLWAIGGDAYEQVQAELPLDHAGLSVLYMPSIKAFRDKKVRILNGSHTAMVPIALQAGCHTVLDAFSNADVNRFINDMMAAEVLPMIDGDPAELQDFANHILERFYNPYIKHQLTSIALNSLSKWEARNWPTAKDYYAKHGRHADHEIFAFAALMSLYAFCGTFQAQDNEESLAIVRQAFSQETDLTAAIKKILQSGIFVEDFEKSSPGFSDTAAKHLSAIIDKGMTQALRDFNEEH